MPYKRVIIIGLVILLFLFLLLIVVFNYFRLLYIPFLSPYLAYLPRQQTTAVLDNTTNPHERPVSIGSKREFIVFTAVFNYVKKVDDGYHLFVTSSSKPEIQQPFLITKDTSIGLAGNGEEDTKITPEQMKIQDSLMISYIVNTETKKGFVSGIRVTR